jgi:hypothetical protein
VKKELLIAAKFDTSEFDKSVESMQKKLKDIYAPVDMIKAQNMTNQRMQQAGLGGMSQPTQDAFIKATQQSRREFDSLIREQAQGQERLTKLIAKREERLKALQDQQNQMVKGSKEELEVKERIARVEENNFRLRELYKQRDQALNQAMDARSKSAPRDIPGLLDHFRFGGFQHGMSQIPGAFKQNPFGMGGALAAGIGGMLSGGAELYRSFAGMPIRTEQATGSAVQGVVGRDVQNVYARRSAFENMFGEERARASQMALEKLRANKIADATGLAGNLLMIGGGAAGAIAGAGKGGALGTAAGSVIPGLGNAAGGIAGGIVGALPGLAAAGTGLYNLMGDERQRSLMLSPFSQTANNNYKATLAAQMAQDYQDSLEAQKNQNPFKTMAINEYEQNFTRNLGMQRMMGLNNQGFYGDQGFMRQGINAGFTPEMAMDMAAGIQGAGGSTRAMRDSAFGLQMQRGFDLTNANQVMGTLSGSLGSSESTRQASIKLLAEGMKQGLDDSQFAEENRRFTQAAAEIISRSGATGESDFDRIASTFGRFLGENTNKGIDAAKNAYEQYQQISSSVSGPRGVMRAAGFLRDDKLRNLSTIDKQALMQVPEEQLNENNLLVQGMADKLGIGSDELVKRIRSVNEGAVSRFGEADKIRDRLRQKGVDISKIRTPEDFQKLPEDVRRDITSFAAMQTTELGYKDDRQVRAMMSGTIGKPEQMGPGVSSDAVKAKMEADTGRMEDNTIRAMAGDAGTVLKNFNEMRGSMDEAAKSAAKFTDQVREMNAALIKALEEARTTGSKTGILDTLTNYLQSNVNQAKTQPQGGKQSR